MKRIFITSDTHLGHANMIPYCGRPENFTELILSNFGKILKPGDILIHLGDICIGKDAEWNARFSLATLGVKCILVKGNHDRKSDSWYLDNGWDFVCHTFSMRTHGLKIVFSHMPVPLSDNDLNIHGHFQNLLNKNYDRDWESQDPEYKNRHSLEHATLNHVNISIEEANYLPILMNDNFLKSIVPVDKKSKEN